MQDANIAEKCGNNAYKAYSYTFPSGRKETIQGYEKYALDDLLNKEKVKEDEIIVSRKDVPECWWIDEDEKDHRYYVDIFIPSQQRCIEVKSTWTAEKKSDIIFLKQQALQEEGYKCEIWIYNGKGELVEKVM